MPKRARSGIRNLYKKHNADCRNREPLKCDCPWYGKYKHVNVNLARWSGQYVDPRRRQHAVVVLNRLRTSIDEHFFRPDGDYEVLGGRQILRSFIVEWREHYGKVHELDFASIDPMLRAIDRDFGSYTLEYLENASLQIERWLNELGRQRRWADNTWNRYYQMFNSLFVRAIKWKNGNVVRMQHNPMAAIERRVGCKRKFRVRVEENVEDRLFAACDRLTASPASMRSGSRSSAKATVRALLAAGSSRCGNRAPAICGPERSTAAWLPGDYFITAVRYKADGRCRTQDDFGTEGHTTRKPHEVHRPCCGRRTFQTLPGSCDICPVCFWQDDPVQLLDPAYRGGANEPSLLECQANYQKSSASEERLTPHVRLPTEGEEIDSEWRPVQDADVVQVRRPKDLSDEEYQRLETWYYWKRGV